MNKIELEKRTRDFTVLVLTFVEVFPNTLGALSVARQLVGAAGSIGANYREANRAESTRDFLHKLTIVEKEAAECEYWLDVVSEKGFGDPAARAKLLKESRELLRIFTSGVRTLKQKQSRNRAIAKSRNLREVTSS